MQPSNACTEKTEKRQRMQKLCREELLTVALQKRPLTSASADLRREEKEERAEEPQKLKTPLSEEAPLPFEEEEKKADCAAWLKRRPEGMKRRKSLLSVKRNACRERAILGRGEENLKGWLCRQKGWNTSENRNVLGPRNPLAQKENEEEKAAAEEKYVPHLTGSHLSTCLLHLLLQPALAESPLKWCHHEGLQRKSTITWPDWLKLQKKPVSKSWLLWRAGNRRRRYRRALKESWRLKSRHKWKWNPAWQREGENESYGRSLRRLSLFGDWWRENLKRSLIRADGYSRETCRARVVSAITAKSIGMLRRNGKSALQREEEISWKKSGYEENRRKKNGEKYRKKAKKENGIFWSHMLTC